MEILPPWLRRKCQHSECYRDKSVVRFFGVEFSDHESQTITRNDQNKFNETKANFCTEPKYLRLNKASNRMQDATEIRRDLIGSAKNEELFKGRHWSKLKIGLGELLFPVIM